MDPITNTSSYGPYLYFSSETSREMSWKKAYNQSAHPTRKRVGWGVDFWNFSKWGLPGRQIVPTTPVSILPPTVSPQRPYGAKIQNYVIFGLF